MKKIIISDTHFGDRQDSEQHNQDLLEFFDYVVQYAKILGITDLIHLGDFFDNWVRMGIVTENYAISAVQALKQQFTSIKLLKGNHDLAMKDSRDISSLEMFRNEVELIDNIQMTHDGLLLVSWLCNEDEYEHVVELSKDKKVKYVLGHFQFLTFEMNDGYTVENGQNPGRLSHVKHVFSGHYHKRQTKGNVTYVGSPFPFDMSDANDFKRGFLVLDTDTETYEFVNYDKIKILSVTYKDFLDESFTITGEKTTIRVVVDEVVSEDTLDAINNKLKTFSLRASSVPQLTNKVKETILQEGKEITDVKNLDELVLDNIMGMTEVESVDKNMMADLYRRAMDMEHVVE